MAKTMTAVSAGSPAWVKAKRWSYSAMPTASAPMSRAIARISRPPPPGRRSRCAPGLTGGLARRQQDLLRI